MNKILMFATVAGLMFSSTALAQNSCLFFDIRDNVSWTQIINSPTYPYTVSALNGGKAGDGQVLYITPHFSDNYETATLCRNGWPNNDGDSDNHTGRFWLYMDVGLPDGGGTGVISSIGLDFNVTPPAAAKNTVGSLTYTWDAGTLTGSQWSWGDGAYQASPQSWLGANAAYLPFGPGGEWSTEGGLVPTNRYRIGKLSVVGGNRNCTYGAGFETNSTYQVRMAVNSLLITRAFEGPPIDPCEDVAFGYAGGVCETPVPGCVEGSTSLLPDATIIVTMKGDNTGDGAVLNSDIWPHIIARSAGITYATQRQVFVNDFNGDRRILTTDNAGFIAARTHTAQGCGPF